MNLNSKIDHVLQRKQEERGYLKPEFAYQMDSKHLFLL